MYSTDVMFWHFLKTEFLFEGDWWFCNHGMVLVNHWDSSARLSGFISDTVTTVEALLRRLFEALSGFWLSVDDPDAIPAAGAGVNDSFVRPFISISASFAAACSFWRLSIIYWGVMLCLGEGFASHLYLIGSFIVFDKFYMKRQELEKKYQNNEYKNCNNRSHNSQCHLKIILIVVPWTDRPRMDRPFWEQTLGGLSMDLDMTVVSFDVPFCKPGIKGWWIGIESECRATKKIIDVIITNKHSIDALVTAAKKYLDKPVIIPRNCGRNSGS